VARWQSSGLDSTVFYAVANPKLDYTRVKQAANEFKLLMDLGDGTT
jgi:hypothetical protein